MLKVSIRISASSSDWFILLPSSAVIDRKTQRMNRAYFMECLEYRIFKTISDLSSFTRWFVPYFTLLFPYLSGKWLERKEKVLKCFIAVVFKFCSSMTFFRALQDYPVLESTRNVDNERSLELRSRLVNMQRAILPVFVILYHVFDWNITAFSIRRLYFTPNLGKLLLQLWWDIHYIAVCISRLQDTFRGVLRVSDVARSGES